MKQAVNINKGRKMLYFYASIEKTVALSNSKKYGGIKAIPIKCFVSRHPTDPFFLKSKIKIHTCCPRSEYLNKKDINLVRNKVVLKISLLYFLTLVDCLCKQ